MSAAAPDDPINVIWMQPDRDSEFAHIIEEPICEPAKAPGVVAQRLAGFRRALERAVERGMDVFGVSRPTVRNWIQGADINNAAIVRILEVGGCEALSWILGASPATKRSIRSQVIQAKEQFKSMTNSVSSPIQT